MTFLNMFPGGECGTLGSMVGGVLDTAGDVSDATFGLLFPIPLSYFGPILVIMTMLGGVLLSIILKSWFIGVAWALAIWFLYMIIASSFDFDLFFSKHLFENCDGSVRWTRVVITVSAGACCIISFVWGKIASGRERQDKKSEFEKNQVFTEKHAEQNTKNMVETMLNIVSNNQ